MREMCLSQLSLYSENMIHLLLISSTFRYSVLTIDFGDNNKKRFSASELSRRMDMFTLKMSLSTPVQRKANCIRTMLSSGRRICYPDTENNNTFCYRNGELKCHASRLARTLSNLSTTLCNKIDPASFEKKEAADSSKSILATSEYFRKPHFRLCGLYSASGLPLSKTYDWKGEKISPCLPPTRNATTLPGSSIWS